MSHNITRYAGGKTRVASDLYAMAPEFDELREPFLGGGSLLWDAPEGKRLWLNEKNPLVYDHYRQLRNDENYINELLEWKDYASALNEHELRGVFDDCRLWLDALRRQLYKTGWQPSRFATLKEYDEAKACCDYCPSYWLLLNRWSIASLVRLSQHDIAAASYEFLEDGMTSVTREKLERQQAVLRRSKLTCLDYSKVLTAPGDNVWVFLDPPYLVSGGNLYDGEPWQESEHVRLADSLRESAHDWLLTINASRYFRRLYAGFRIHERLFTCAMPHKYSNKQDKFGSEFWVMNYPSRFESWISQRDSLLLSAA
ncbi:MAG: DNA adenine methylase [Phycisphaerales bacterium]|nr:DNA adenine methylase [Phycisphaerales bacterium]